MNNFDLKKFLIENKLTTNSRIKEINKPSDTVESLAADILADIIEDIWHGGDTAEMLNHEFGMGLSDEEVQKYEPTSHFGGFPEEFLETFDHFVEKGLIEDPYKGGVHLTNHMYEDGDEDSGFAFDDFENRFPETIAKLRELEAEDPGAASAAIVDAMKRLTPEH